MDKEKNVTAEYVRQILHYDPNTGNFTRIASPRSKRWVGTIAGRKDRRGCICIKIGKVGFTAHRLAWLYMTGEWPKQFIDHIDMNPSNNAFSNLREANNSQNKANMRMRADNTTGLKGVTKKNTRWRAQIGAGKEAQFLGSFDCPASAHFAYIIAADKKYGAYARAS